MHKKHIFLEWFWKNKLIIIFILILSIIYTIIHEFIHHVSYSYFGYSVKYCWTCIPTQINIITPLNEITKAHYFISSMAPYVFASLLLLLLLGLYMITKNKWFVILSAIPFLDAFFNIFFGIPIANITNSPNDFLNLFRIGFSWQVFPFMLLPLVLFLVIVLRLKK